MPILKRAFNNFFWLFLSEAISKGLIFLGIVYLSRVLGKAGFGLYSLAIAVGVYFWTLVDMGISGYGTREVARDKEKAAELYCLLNSFRFLLAIILFIVFWLTLFCWTCLQRKVLSSWPVDFMLLAIHSRLIGYFVD